MDVRLAGVDRVDFRGVDVEAEDRGTVPRELKAKRESDVAESDDGKHGEFDENVWE